MFPKLKDYANGAAILADWLGEGGVPVSIELASRRARPCFTCAYNIEGTWWEREVNSPVAKTIKEQLEVKNRIELRLTSEDELGTCGICRCNLRLKPWVPIEHIRKHSDPEHIKAFPEHCHYKKELS